MFEWLTSRIEVHCTRMIEVPCYNTLWIGERKSAQVLVPGVIQQENCRAHIFGSLP